MTRRAAGYTLIEVIVAFAVLAVALTLLLGTLTNASRQVHWSTDAGRAALLAQGLLDDIDTDGALREGERDGSLEDGRYRWTLRVRRYDDGTRAGQPVDANAPVPMTLDLTVEWGNAGPRERIELHSLRLVPSNMGGPT